MEAPSTRTGAVVGVLAIIRLLDSLYMFPKPYAQYMVSRLFVATYPEYVQIVQEKRSECVCCVVHWMMFAKISDSNSMYSTYCDCVNRNSLLQKSSDELDIIVGTSLRCSHPKCNCQGTMYVVAQHEGHNICGLFAMRKYTTGQRKKIVDSIKKTTGGVCKCLEHCC
jgi:hypothetical protein